MVKRENFDELSIGASDRITNLEGNNLSIDSNGNLAAAGGGGEGGEGYLVDDFAAGNLSGYSGDTDNFSVVAGDISGGNMLEFYESGQTGAMQRIWNEIITTQRGMTYVAYLRPNGASASPGLIVNGQADSTAGLNAGYGVVLASSGDEVRLVKETTAADDSFFTNTLDVAAVAINGGTLYRVDIDLHLSGYIEGRVTDDAGTLIATVSGTDSDFQTGVLGWRNASSNGTTSDYDFAFRLPHMIRFATSSSGGGGGGGGTVEGDDSFLFESFEDLNYNMIEDPDDTGGYVPNYDEAITLDQNYTREGDVSFRIHIDYDWDYGDLRHGTNKPIPDNRDLMQEQGWSIYGEPIWYAFSLGLDNNWQPDAYIEQIMEFHRDISENPGDTNQEKKDYSGSQPGKPITTWVDGNQLKFRNSYVTNDTAYDEIYDGPTVSAGNWYDIVMNLKWVRDDMNDTGFIRIWVDGEQWVDYTGNTTSLDVAPPRPVELRIYKWLWNQSSNEPDQMTRTYYFDEVRYGWADATLAGMTPGLREGSDGSSFYPDWWVFKEWTS